MTLRLTLATMLATALVIAGAGLAGAKPPVSAPVKITIKSKEVTPTGCPELCIEFFGEVRAPKSAACARNRQLGADLKVRYQGKVETHPQDYFVKTDQRGSFSTMLAMLDGQRILSVIVRLPQKRIGGVLCKAASAKITL